MLHNIQAVSYTHLDVYKRQALEIVKLCFSSHEAQLSKILPKYEIL